MAKSILQKDKECYLCRRFYNLRTVRGLEEHTSSTAADGAS